MAKTVYVELHNVRFAQNRTILELLEDIPDFEGVHSEDVVLCGIDTSDKGGNMEVWEVTLLKRDTSSDLYIQTLADPYGNENFTKLTTDVLTERLRSLGGTPTYGIKNRNGHLTAVTGCDLGKIQTFFIRHLKPTIH